MGFAYQLQDSLRDRDSRVALEFAAGDSLETVLDRHLFAVEQSAETELFTSILLLDEAGKHILHGAAPSLPKSYCEAIHGAEIGSSAGSCGTAAYFGHAIYVTDIATDSLWNDYRHLALQHGLRACWSTPIRKPDGELLGTFAVYHPTPRSPTPDEVESIRLITDHVAQAIMFSRSSGAEIGQADSQPADTRPGLKLVSDHDPDTDDPPRNGAAGRFAAYASKLDRYAEMVASRKFAAALKAVAEDCRKLGDAVRDRHEDPKGDS